jgi:L-iditol 2-dehydrogenase
MRAAIYIDEGKIETRQTETPQLSSGDVLLKVYACGVCGTDIRKVQHHLVTPPTVLGHEVAGEVVEVGSDVNKFKVGDRVVVAHHTPCYNCHYCKHGNFSMCREFKRSNLDPGGFAEFLRIPKRHVELTAHRIPDEMSYETAIFMEPLACVVRNLKRASLERGDTLLIVGLGSMGLLTGQLAKSKGMKVIATDLRDDRIQTARALGFDIATRADDKDIKDKVERLTDHHGVDLVVLTAGNAQTYGDMIRYVRDGGAINIFAGLPPGAKLAYDVNEIYSREITVFSSYSPSPAELTEALELLHKAKVRVDVLEPKTYPLTQLSDAIAAAGSQQILKAIIAPQELSLS